MLWEHSFTPADLPDACRALVDAWHSDENKIFVLRASGRVEDPRALFEAAFPHLGTPVPLGEDVQAGDRSQQRTGQFWTEVRYDPRFTDAYRHSANAQPLHTDGSYIASYPNATIMVCVANSDDGGETTFLDPDAVIEALGREAPGLLAAIESPLPHRRSGDVRVEPVDNPVVVAAVVTLASNLDYQETAGFHFTYDLADQPARSTAITRVNPGYASVVPFAVGDPGIGEGDRAQRLRRRTARRGSADA